MLAIESGTCAVVTERGEEQVSFESGGWCIQRPFGWETAEEGQLRFWLDTSTGCARRDVSVPAGERIFFCTSVWDDAAGLEAMAAERADIAAQLAVNGEIPPGALTVE